VLLHFFIALSFHTQYELTYSTIMVNIIVFTFFEQNAYKNVDVNCVVVVIIVIVAEIK